MVDEERVARLLDRVTEDVRILRGYRNEHADIRNDATLLAATKYHFITGIEGCARVAHHIAAAEGWPASESNSDAIRQLATERVVEEAIGQSVAKAVGFRNVLVHEYADVDDKYVMVNLDHVEDLEQFAAQVAEWLTGRSTDATG